MYVSKVYKIIQFLTLKDGFTVEFIHINFKLKFLSLEASESKKLKRTIYLWNFTATEARRVTS